MNMIMSDGKKSVAERIIYGALDRTSDRETHSDDKALELLEAPRPEKTHNTLLYWLERRVHLQTNLTKSAASFGQA